MDKLVAEYSTATPPSNPTINYTATDQLGSPRIITDKFGQVVSRRDFMPFGEELYADGTYRKTGDKYSLTGQDVVRQRFTGYQKDMETGLDFAEARYYNNQHGRFTAVDPLLASGKSANPQTFNRYVYTMNRPLALKDRSGLQAGTEENEIIRINTVICRNGGSSCSPPMTSIDRSLTYDGQITRWKDYIPSNVLSPVLFEMPPIGQGMEQRMEREIQIIGETLVEFAKTAAYRAVPDVVEGGVSLPFYSGGFQVSKNGNVFLGGNFTLGSGITDWLGDIKSSNKAIYPKLSLGFGAKWFERNLTEERRDAAISGAEMEIQASYVTFAKPATGDGPRSVKIGKPGLGFGGSYTSEKFVDFDDTMEQLRKSAARYFGPSNHP